MNLYFDQNLCLSYTNTSQKIRIMSEAWGLSNLFCPNCLKKLAKFPNNNPIGDFYCPDCNEEFELKSKLGKYTSKIVDGAYQKMIQRITSSQNPNFLFLSYDNKYSISDLFLIPKHFMIPEIIEQRQPLSLTARRSGWVGCNILLSNLPQIGKIPYVLKSTTIEKEVIRNKWESAFKLRTQPSHSKGWIYEILRLIENLGSNSFTLHDIYSFEASLKYRFPENNNIRPKIRQQLQILRDMGYISFLGQARYLKRF